MALLRFFLAITCCAFTAARSGAVANTTSTPIAGQWELDRSRSDDPSAWSTIRLDIAVADGRLDLRRTFVAMSRRQFSDRMVLDLDAPETVVPLEYWPDNRYIGVSVGGDRSKRVRSTWLDEGRILRLSSDLVLATQQGERAVNVLSDYKVSANGRELTLIEIRSTRNRPVVYVFKRIAP